MFVPMQEKLGSSQSSGLPSFIRKTSKALDYAIGYYALVC
ncbi:hypothetical protein GCM10010217_74070 [Streptomyces tubercidicus]